MTQPDEECKTTFADRLDAWASGRLPTQTPQEMMLECACLLESGYSLNDIWDAMDAHKEATQ